MAEGAVWVDAVQWEEGEVASAWSELPVFTDAAAPEFVAVDAVPGNSDGEGSWEGSVPLKVFLKEGKEESYPVTLGVPFSQGRWNGKGSVYLTNPQGSRIPVQTEILVEQPGTGDVRMLGLQFTDRLQAGWQDYTLEIKRAAAVEEPERPFQWRIKKPTLPGRLWEGISDSVSGTPLFKAASLRGVGIDGEIYDSEHDPAAVWKVEQDGPLAKVYSSTGRLMNQEGRALLGYVARLYSWHDIPGVKVEVSLINTRKEGSIPVRSLYWHTESADGKPVMIHGEPARPEGDRFEVAHHYVAESDRFVARRTSPSGEVPLEGRSPQSLEVQAGQRTFLLHAPEAWQRNPSALAWDRGRWQGYLWPATGVRALLFPRGLALTREFWLREGSSKSDRLAGWEQSPLAIAAPQWWAENDLLIPSAASDSSRHPFMDEALAAPQLIARIGPERVEQTRAWGAFDFGDSHGDGGWGNQESFNDWSALFIGLRSSDETALEIGLRAARHYRDIDINQVTGECYTHNLNHISGSTATSHAWPGGVALHYLLTGSKRSKEVVLQHGESLLALLNERSDGGTRVLGRLLMNLADLYLVSGDERYKARFYSQVESSREALKNDSENPDRSIFSNINRWQARRLVPYHAWYGIAALQTMHDLTGDSGLNAFISEEIAATLNPELYQRDIAELWPGLTLEEGMPLMIADFAQHRGSYFYPVAMVEAEVQKRPDRAKLALDALYAWAAEGRGGTRIQSILGAAALRAFKETDREEDLLAAAGETMWKGAAETLLNGDFSISDTEWPHWRPFPGKSLSYHTNWNETRKRMVTLDPEIRKEGPRSLRFNLMPKPFFNRISVDTHRFRLPAGRARVTGWLRWDEGAKPPTVRMDLRDLRGNFERLNVPEREGGLLKAVEKSNATVELATLSPPDAEGWRRFEMTVAASRRAVGNVVISSSLQPNAAGGQLWVDSFRIAPVTE